MPHVDSHAVLASLRSRLAPWLLASCLALGAWSPAALAQTDPTQAPAVFDQFFRFGSSASRPSFQELPGETVDPFTGDLRITQEDVSFPGVAGHDLRIVRAYSSKIWARADGLAVEPLLAEAEHTVLGYGWTMHFGRIRAPNASGTTSPCWSDLPVFEEQSGAAHVLYPSPAGQQNTYVSKDYWRMERACSVPDSTGLCVWSPDGVRYEFGGGIDESGVWQKYVVGGTLFYPVTAVVDPAGSRISASYSMESVDGTIHYANLQLASLTDTYGRVVTFSYDTRAGDGDRLAKITVPADGGGTKDYTYEYASYATIAGPRRLLSKVTSPQGTAYRYLYNAGSNIASNPYGLAAMTYPLGATTTYTYGSVNFFTGNEMVPFSVVKTRQVAGNKMPTAPPALWQYSYVSPGVSTTSALPLSTFNTNFHVTTITRPDGATDVHKLIGFGWVADYRTAGLTYLVGLPHEVRRGNGWEVESFEWDARGGTPVVAGTYYSWPAYGPNCAGSGGYQYADYDILAPALRVHRVWRDNPSFLPNSHQTTWMTEVVNSDFDDFAQPRHIVETGYNNVSIQPTEQAPPPQVRTTDLEYFSVLQDDSIPPVTLNILTGRPTSRKVCVKGGADCSTSLWEYEGPGHQRSSETTGGVETTFHYYPVGDTTNGPGNLWRVRNAKGQTLTLSGYTAGHGVPSDLDFNGEFTIHRTASVEGWVLSETDGRNKTTGFQRDLIGRVWQVTPPASDWPTGEGLPSTTAYPLPTCWTGASPLCKERLTRGAYWRETELDGLGRPIKVTDSAGVQSSTVYDALGRATFQSYPFDATTGEVGDSLGYDSIGRLRLRARAQLKSGGSAGLFSTHDLSYSHNCAFTRVIRSAAGTSDSYLTTHCEKWFGQPDEHLLWEAVQGDWTAWWYDHNSAGQLLGVTAPVEAGDRTYTYVNQFLETDTTGEAGQISFTPNELHQVATRTDARGVVTTFDRADGLSRLTGVRFDGLSGEDWTQDYDLANNLWHLQSANGGTYTYDHDELNRVRRQTWVTPAGWSPAGARSYETSFDFDSAGCMTSLAYPSGLTLTITCDSANRVTSVSAGGAQVVGNIQYHPSGQPKSYQLGNALTQTTTYDALSRTKTIAVPGVVNLQYGYNGADNMTSLCRDEGDGSCLTKAVYADATCQTAPVPPVRGFCYDDVNRLLIATAPAAGQWGTLLYDYDWLGNRYFKSGYFDRAGDQTTTYVFDGKNRLDSTVGTETVPTMTFTWNKAGQLASSSDGAAYRYDGHGRRVLKSAPTGAVVYHHDPLGRVLAETLPDGTKLRDYIYLGNRLVAVDGCVEGDTPPCSGLHWYHTDTLGSVLARTGPGGQVEARMDYQPWGEEWASTGHVGSRQYNGRVYDPGTGFHDYGARLYWPQIGRFISADSVMGSPGSPMTLNRYSYVLNNPYKYTDPTGHSELAFNREQHVLVITGSIPGRVDSDPVVLGSFPAFNNTDSRSKGQWPEGTFARTHYNPHPESGADGAYGSNGIQVFSVNDANGRMPDRQVQRPGMGVHSGRENTPDGLGRKGPEAATMGCIRTTDAGSAAVNRVHAVDPVKTITVKNKVDRPAGSGYRDAGAAR